VYLPGKLLGPNATVRRWIRDLERRVHAELGRPTPAEQIKSVLAVGAALWTGLTLKLGLFQHPRLTRTAYRLPAKGWSGFHLWEDIPLRISVPDLSIRVDLQHARKRVWLRLEGVLPAAHADELARRIQESLAQSKCRLVLDLYKLRCERADDLRPLLERLSGERSRIRLVLPRLSAVHPELMLLVAMFQHYKG
jgi:hypothetical protein